MVPVRMHCPTRLLKLDLGYVASLVCLGTLQSLVTKDLFISQLYKKKKGKKESKRKILKIYKEIDVSVHMNTVLAYCQATL